MTGIGVPGAFTRLRRNRPLLLLAVLTSGLAISSSGVSESLLVRIAGEVDHNWRGAYDLLVRPPGSRLDLESTNGVVEPNFLGFTGQGGISEGQLEAIRSIPDVELAAPVAFLGYLQYVITAPTVSIGRFPSKPTLFEITVTARSSDGLRDVLVQEHTARLLIGPVEDLANIRWATDYGDRSVGQDQAGRFSADITSRLFLPPIASPLMAVDPDAEAALLGPSGAFLQPLRALAGSPRTVEKFPLESIPDQYDLARSAIRELRITNEVTKKRPVIPIVVSRQLYAPLRLELRVDQIGHPLDEYPPGDSDFQRLEAAAASAGPGRSFVGSDVLDATSLLQPFSLAPLTLYWPGSPRGSAPYVLTMSREFEARLPMRPSYTTLTPRPGGSALSFRIEPVGEVGPDGNTLSSSDQQGPVTLGTEMAYRRFGEVPIPLAEHFEYQGGYDYPFVFAPVGAFDLTRLNLPDNPLTYVPLGVYDPPRTRLVADADGRPLPPVEMTPTLNPAGLIAVPPLAITDLEGARLLRGDAPIDAIRVRVAGLTDYSSAARQRVEAVASAIRSLGLDVDVVAGSSPQQVDIYVPSYDTSATPPRDLGWVTQGWTTLGAAERVERGLTGTTVTLLGLAAAAALLGLVGVAALQAAARVREASLLVAYGWTERMILRWFVDEFVAAAAVVGGLALLGWLLGGRSLLALMAGAALAGMLPVGAFFAGHVATRNAVPTSQFGSAGDLWFGVPTGRSLGVRGPITLGIRMALSRPLRFVATVASIGLATGILAVALVVLGSTANRVGPTLLAEALLARISSLEATLALLTASASLVLGVGIWRWDGAERREEIWILIGSGWTRSMLNRVTMAWAATVIVPGAGIGMTVAEVLLGPALGLQAGSSAILASVLALCIGAVGWILVNRSAGEAARSQ